MNKIQIVCRRKPKVTVYVRKAPTTIERPTMAQAELRAKLAELSRESRLLSVEEVARLVGGEVIKLNGKKAVRMPDGRILLKQMAYVGYMLKNYRSKYSRIRIPAWLEELARRQSIPIYRVVEEYIRKAK
jgi:hypothetical protein